MVHPTVNRRGSSPIGAPMRDVQALARRQGGVVLRRQLRDLGFTWSRIHAAKRAGELKENLGALAVRGGMPGWALQRTPAFQRALQDAHAMQLVLGPAAIISGATAAVLQGMEGKGRDADWPERLAMGAHMAYVPSRQRPRVRGIRAIRARFTGRARELHGVRLADAATALIDSLEPIFRSSAACARALLDLFLQLRWLAPKELRSRMDARLAQNGPRGPSRRQTQLLRWAVRCAGEGTQSEAERRLVRLLREHRFRRGGKRGWRANHEVHVVTAGGGSKTYRLDVAWESQRVAIEVDGREYHSGAAAFERDRNRLAELAAAGWTVLPLTWDAIVHRPEWVIERLSAALRQPRPNGPNLSV